MSEDNNKVARRAETIAEALAAADAGDRAAARRMGAQGSALFWRLVAQLDIPSHQEDLWRRNTRMVALLTPSTAIKTIHDKRRRLGAVLADGGQADVLLDKPFLSEQRLARLLAARGTARLDALERVIRMIARVRPALNVADLAWAVLRDNLPNLARAYYARLDRRSDVAEKQNDET